MLWSLLALSFLPPPTALCPPEAAPAGFGPVPFVIAAPQASGPVVNAASFGVNAAAKDNYQAFMAVFEACRRQGAGTLKIPPGTYRFDASTKPLTIWGLRDLRIEAQGATLLFSQIPVPGRLIHLTGNARVSIEGLSVDWDWAAKPLAYVAEVMSNAGGGSNLVLRFPGGAPAGLKLHSFEMVEPKTWDPLPGGEEIGDPRVQKYRRTDKDTLVVRGGFKLGKLRKGHWVRMRQYDYQAHAIEVEDSEDISFKACNVWAAPGMAFVLRGDTQRVEWLQCRVEPKGDRPLSVAADGIHVAHSKGGLRIEGCIFRTLGDDCLNIKDDISIGMQQENAQTLVLENLAKWRNRFAPGDTLELRRPDYASPFITPPIKSVEWIGNDRCRLRFGADLPPVKDKTMVFNRRYGSANTIIRGNTFRGNRARGALIKAPGVLIEKNLFYRTGGPAIYYELGRWGGVGLPEGTLVTGNLVKNNRFTQNNAYGWGEGVVQFNVLGLGRAPVERPFKDIRFEGNLFEAYKGYAIVARFVDRLTLRGNVYKPSPPAKAGDGRVRIEDCAAVRLQCDRWDPSAPAAARGYDLDRVDSKSLL